MAVSEVAAFIKCRDLEGNTNLIMPITTVDNVDGMDEIMDALDSTVKFTEQTLSEEQKAQARTNLGITETGSSGVPSDVILYTQQTLTEAQKAQARANIGVMSVDRKLTTILEERVVTGFQMDNVYGYATIASDILSVEIGELYMVVWDSTSYEVIAANGDSFATGGILLGNGASVGLTGNNEPFAIGILPTGVTFFALDDPTPEHTIAIYKVDEPLSVPPFTVDDEGKTLSVKNGTLSWETVESSGDGNITAPDDTITEILPQQNITFAYNDMFGEIAWVSSPAPFALVIGEKYNITWETEEHECTAFDLSSMFGEGAVGLGNEAMIGGADTGECFMFGYSPTNDMCACILMDAEASGSYNVHIYQVKEKSELPTVTTADNGKILQVVNGVWTAVTIAESSIKTYLDEYIRSVLERDY